MEKVLITGGSGLVGTHLTEVLKENGYTVAHLGRKEGENNGVKTYRWDYSTGFIDLAAFEGVTYIINLAGANVAGGRWTKAYKKIIYDSRVLSTRLLVDTIKTNGFRIKKFISASATGYYGNVPNAVTEESPASKDFLSVVCSDWEAEANKIKEPNIPVAILRIGIVLTPKGGFVPEMAKPIKMGLGAILGSGKQAISWIHIDDLCGIVLKALSEPGFTGAYNCVTATPTTNEDVTRLMAKLLRRPLWLPKVPTFALKIILGGMSYELLVNHNASAQKIINAGYVFKHTDIKEILVDWLYE